jgi:hypothetical protein
LFNLLITLQTVIGGASCKSQRMPFDKLRANGCRIEIISFLPFVVSLSNHLHYFCKKLWGKLNSCDYS